MPKKQNLKCYFGCVIDGPLHHYPKPLWPHMERFNSWKSVLRQDTQDLGDNYIFNQVRLCYRHFESYYCLPSKLLTRNAIPTLNLGSPSQIVREPVSMPEIIDVPTTAGIFQLPVEVPVIATTSQIPPAIVMVPESKPEIPRTIRICKNKFVCPYKNKDILKLKMRLQKMRDKCNTQTKQIRKAVRLSQSQTILKEMDKMTKSAQIFIKMQMKAKTKARGRRYTLKEKILSLTILKQSPKGYNFLKSIFSLPSKRTLQKVMKLLVIKPGINQEIFDNIKLAVRKYPQEKKLVSLMFDEVSLAPGLFYNKSLQEMVGFEDFGTRKTQNFADHALVFMVKGMKSKFKQPVCFTFCKSATKKNDLKNLIKAVVKQINDTGLIVVATICDQSSTNIATINSLRFDTKELYLKKGEEYKSQEINIDGIVLYPLFDPPHLLKGIRNNLLIKNLRYTHNNKVKMAKWEHLEMLLKEDVGEDEIRLVNKLTESHVYKDKIPKMKVKHAAQVFSQRVSSAMRFLARRGILPSECEETSEVLLIFDKIFDSFNGHSYKESHKMFKVCLKHGSPHFKLWDEVIPIIRSMGFERRKKQRDGTYVIKYEKVPSLNNFIHNMKTVKEMSIYLKERYNVTSIIMRNLNQDPLENFFCQIRSNGIRNVNPSAQQFANAYKTLLINNFSSPHSVNANCEEDSNKSLKSIKLLFKKNVKVSNTLKESLQVDFELINYAQEAPCNNYLHNEAKSYVTGYVLKKCRLTVFKKCLTCTTLMFAQKDGVESDYIRERDVTHHSLCYPSNEFKTLMNEIYSTIVTCLRKIPHEHNLHEKICLYIDINCNFNIINCRNHKQDLTKQIIDLAINIIVHSWCKGVNCILNGKLKVFDERDPIKTAAMAYYNTRKHKK